MTPLSVLRLSVQRMARPAAAALVIFAALCTFAGFQSVVSQTNAPRPDRRAEREQYCATTAIRPVGCDDLVGAGDPALEEAKSYMTPLGKVDFVLNMMASMPGTFGFALLFAVVTAQEWTGRGVVVRRQLVRSGPLRVIFDLAAFVVVLCASTVAALVTIIAVTGPSGSGPDLAVVAADTVAMLAATAMGAVFGVVAGSLIRNPVGAGAAVTALFFVGTRSELAPTGSPMRLVAEAMGYLPRAEVINDRFWPVVVDASHPGPAIAGLLVYVLVGAAVSAFLWRRQVMV